jgi:hypothetical protein
MPDLLFLLHFKFLVPDYPLIFIHLSMVYLRALLLPYVGGGKIPRSIQPWRLNWWALIKKLGSYHHLAPGILRWLKAANQLASQEGLCTME